MADLGVDRGRNQARPRDGNFAGMNFIAAEYVLQELALVGIDEPAAMALFDEDDDLFRGVHVSVFAAGLRPQ